MTNLTRAITLHDLDGIAAAIAAAPEEIHERVSGWLPIQWAERTNNPVTYARVVRLLGSASGHIEHRLLLKNYVVAISSNYFGGGSPEQSAVRAWEQIHRGIVRPFSKSESDFILSDEQKMDLVHLLKEAGVDSEAALVELVRECITTK